MTQPLMLLFSAISRVMLLNIYHLNGPFTSELPSDVAGNLGHSSKNFWNTLCLIAEQKFLVSLKSAAI